MTFHPKSRDFLLDVFQYNYSDFCIVDVRKLIQHLSNPWLSSKKVKLDFCNYYPGKTMLMLTNTSVRPTMPYVQGNTTVLIIDTNADFVRSLREMLLQKGYRVQTASAPAELCYAVTTPDLILCDMSLALYQGVASLKQLRTRLSHKRVPLLLMSWHGTLHDIRYALKVGADDCVAKKMSLEMLGMVIDARLQKVP